MPERDTNTTTLPFTAFRYRSVCSSRSPAATAREGISHRMVNIAAADLARQKLEPLPMNHIRLAPEKVRRISSSFPQTNCRHLLMLFSSSRISFSVLYIRVSSQS